MRSFIAGCLLFLLAFNCKAQLNSAIPTDKQVLAKIASLKNKGIDSVACYYMSCDGIYRPYIPDTCIAYDIKYLIWTEQNNYVMQRFDECKTYDPKAMVSPVLNLIKHNYAAIDNEKVKHFGYTGIYEGKPADYEISIDHDCNNYFLIYTGDKLIRKYIEGTALLKQYEDHLNSNYDYNKGLLITQLIVLMEDQVKKYNK